METLSEYAADPVGFVTHVLPEGGVPYSKQAEVLSALAADRRVTVVGCNGSGKDWAAARAVLWWIETRERSKAIVTGPTQRQVEDVIWREMRVAYAMAGQALHGEMYASKYVVNDERFALGFSTNHPYNLQGFHSPQLLVVVTEAHAVGQLHMDALKRLNPARMLLTGNPLTLEGEFFESHHSKSYLYTRVAISAFDTPNLIENRADAAPGMVTPEDVEERRREWGDKDALYVASVLGQFPDALEDSLISRSDVDRAVERWEQGEPRRRDPWRMGVDVARYGDDKTVLCLRRGDRVERMIEMRKADTVEVAEEIGEQVRRLGIPAVFVDETGVGGGVVDQLKKDGMPVIGVQAGTKASRPEQYGNKRAELFWELRRRFKEDSIAIPKDDELISQLLMIRYAIAEPERIRLNSKQEFRKRGLPSPDKADALSLAFLEPRSMDLWV